MIYPFTCSKCGFYKEIVAHHTDKPDTIKCEECGKTMNRKWTPVQTVLPKVGYFDHGLGIQVNSKRDIKDAINNIRDTTGRDVEEVGDVNYKPPSLTSDEKWDRHIQELSRSGAFDNISDSDVVDMGA